MEEGKIYIGTSGWNYNHWQGVFYPKNLKSQDFLSYYTKYFSTVEINSSFYHLPKEKTFIHWSEKTPKNFLFAIKVWRRITHLKKLNRIESDLKIFGQRVLDLKKKTGPLLFQFSPSFHANPLKLEKLAKFIRENSWSNSSQLAKACCVFEFRHQSWFQQPIYQILKKYNLTLCWADTPNYPYQEIVTTKSVYFRLHGHKQLYTSKYTFKQLKNYAQKIKKLIQENKTVYVYFDNDAYGRSIKNAQELKKLLS